MEKASHAQTKLHNARLVLQIMYQERVKSRAELARITGLTRPTVSGIVEELIERNLLRDVGSSPAARGKPPIQVEFNKNAYEIIALEASAEKMVGVVTNLLGEIQIQQETPLSPVGDIQKLIRFLQYLKAQTTLPVLGVGISISGIVNSSSGVVDKSLTLNWQNFAIKKELEAELDLPVMVANDCDLVALGEFRHLTRPSQQLVAIKFSPGSGIGAGIIIDGTLYSGDHHSPGEIGHTVVEPNGVLCSCGNHGCLEATIPHLLAGYRVQGSEQSEWKSLASAVQKADPQALQDMAKLAKYVARPISFITGLLDIENVLLAGEIVQLGEPFMVCLRQTLTEYVLPYMAEKVTVRYSETADSGLQGAVNLVLLRQLGIQ